MTITVVQPVFGSASHLIQMVWIKRFVFDNLRNGPCNVYVFGIECNQCVSPHLFLNMLDGWMYNSQLWQCMHPFQTTQTMFQYDRLLATLNPKSTFGTHAQVQWTCMMFNGCCTMILYSAITCTDSCDFRSGNALLEYHMMESERRPCLPLHVLPY